MLNSPQAQTTSTILIVFQDYGILSLPLIFLNLSLLLSSKLSAFFGHHLKPTLISQLHVPIISSVLAEPAHLCPILRTSMTLITNIQLVRPLYLPHTVSKQAAS